MGDMITCQDFDMYSDIRAFQHTLNHDCRIRKSEPALEKKRKRKKNRSSEPTETLEISSFHQFLRNFSTSGGSKKFSMGDMIMFKVFKRLP